MQMWSPDRYRALAERCRVEAQFSRATLADALKTMAAEFDAKALCRDDGRAI